MLTQGKSTGFIEVAPKLDTDFVVGGESAVTPLLSNPSGNWQAYLPTPQWQKVMGADFDGDSGFDVLACVTFGAVQDVETLLNYQIKNHVLDASDITWLQTHGYIDANGSVACSKRFTAKMSGTTIDGNSLPKVWESIRHEGLVPEASWPMPANAILALFQKGGTWQEAWDLYYAEPTNDLILLGREFAARFNVNYEWIAFPGYQQTTQELEDALSAGPIEISTAVCNPWNTSAPINGCGPGAQHATLLYDIPANGDFLIFDHYSPFDKTLAANYNITYAMRGTISPASLKPKAPTAFTYTFTTRLTFQGKNDPVELKALQTALQFLTSPKTGKAYMAAGVFGPFGPMTKACLAAFQADHGIADQPAGADFGPQCWAAMNTAINS